jgi:hypothetical protein
MQRPSVSEATRAEYDQIAERLAAQAGVKAGQMMGMPMLYLDGKAVAGLFGDAMIFKLDGDAHAAALARRGATLFDPSGMGRPMKAWVQVPTDDAQAWPGLADEALAARLR